MLKDHNSAAIVAVSDLGRARNFYGEVLGLELAEEGAEEGVLVCKTGATELTVYQSDFAGTNRANALVWDVGTVPGTQSAQFRGHNTELAGHRLWKTPIALRPHRGPVILSP